MQGNTSKPIDRHPSVAGKFYPEDPDKLQQELTSLFASAVSKKCDNVRAILSPHAGYIYSGKIAAAAFNQIDARKQYKRVFLVASSHHISFNKAAVYCDGDFIMPYGKEIVDTDFGKMLVERFPDIFTANPEAHIDEHSLEVQLPFLHYALKTSYCIVPIVIGTNDPAVSKRIASVLKRYLSPENLFIISSDFSHYPEYSDAQKVDAATKEAILSNDPARLLTTLSENAKKHIPHLATSLCGWASVLTLLYMTTHNDSLEYQAIEYSNSGDVKYYGEHDRVVGYWGIVLSEKGTGNDGFQLTEADKEKLLDIAGTTLQEYCLHNKKYNPDARNLSPTLQTNCGAFVSLHENGKLRGCIGRLVGNLPLYKMVQEMTIAAASHDRRFMPVELEELPEINIEISVLSPLKKIDDIAEIELGKHGIFIEEGYHTGVFLPQVATETGWDKEEFLGHCARDKAGLDWDGWKKANLFIFTATVFS
ncbi:MAG: AmmeMemoRadiSam system protein B [Bacteroidota bacterium]|nr:AmmeMemoRadiSam system protein B [Bacteroidota bacterium]